MRTRTSQKLLLTGLLLTVPGCIRDKLSIPAPLPEPPLPVGSSVRPMMDLQEMHGEANDFVLMRHYLGVMPQPVYCTKMASRLVRTFTDRHGLKDLARDLLGVELSKEQQSSDWGAGELTAAQQRYAAADVVHLHAIKRRLDEMLAREGRAELAQSVFACLPVRAELDLLGWAETDF
ncbi:MAG: hypothetical protein ACKO2L_20910, partial [Planctomycetaceae bacterium]